MALADFDLILFGGTGDLAMRKLLPALYALDRANSLPPAARVICIGRNDWTQQEFINSLNDSAKLHSGTTLQAPDSWDNFCARLTYISLDATDIATYPALIKTLRADTAITRVFYLAMP